MCHAKLPCNGSGTDSEITIYYEQPEPFSVLFIYLHRLGFPGNGCIVIYVVLCLSLSMYKVVGCKNATKLVYSKILCSISAPSPISKCCAVITYLCEKTSDLGYIGLCECLFTLDEQTSVWC